MISFLGFRNIYYLDGYHKSLNFFHSISKIVGGRRKHKYSYHRQNDWAVCIFNKLLMCPNPQMLTLHIYFIFFCWFPHGLKKLNVWWETNKINVAKANAHDDKHDRKVAGRNHQEEIIGLISVPAIIDCSNLQKPSVKGRGK